MEHANPTAAVVHWYDETAHGRMRLTGANARALLHRLSTNHLEQLPVNAATYTVLTTPQGRSMDLLQVIHLPEAVWVCTSAGQGPTVYSHLKKNIFFNDHVTIAPAAQSHRQTAFYGAGATAWLSAQTGLDLAALPPTGAVRWGDAILVRCIPLAGEGWRVLEPIADTHTLLPRAELPQLDDATLSRWQLEAGVPAYGTEYGLEYVPLESGLDAYIHSAKGCYVGQEIIARMTARNRRAKTLERVVLDAPVSTPAPLTLDDGNVVGTVTRVATSSAGVLGFAFITTKVDTSGALWCTGTAVRRLAAADTVQEPV